MRMTFLTSFITIFNQYTPEIVRKTQICARTPKTRLMVSNFGIFTLTIYSRSNFCFPVTTKLDERFSLETETKRQFYQIMSRFGPPSRKSPYVCYKWSLQGPVTPKTQVDCERQRVKWRIDF